MAEVDERVRAWSVKTIEGLMDGSNSIPQKKTRLALHAHEEIHRGNRRRGGVGEIDNSWLVLSSGFACPPGVSLECFSRLEISLLSDASARAAFSSSRA
jgi:hypothetical protein